MLFPTHCFSAAVLVFLFILVLYHMKNLFFKGSLPIKQLCLILLGASLWPEMELLVPSLPDMKNYFGVTEGQIQQLLSANFIGFIIGVIFAGPFCDGFGRRKVTIFGMLFYLVLSAFVALSNDFSSMMLLRFLQGIAITGPIIGGITILMESTKGKEQIFWLSISSASVTFCMAGAPIFGSWVNNYFGFRANLWSIFIMGVIGFLPFLFLVKETLAKESREKINIKSILKNYFEISKNKKFMLITSIMATLSASYWIYTGVSSLYMVDYLKLDASLFGRYQGPIVGTFAILSVCISFLDKKFGFKKCLLTGFISMFFGATSLMIFSILHIESVFLTTFFMIFFVGGMVPANSLLFPAAINVLPTNLQGSGQSMVQALRLIIASLGTMTLGVVYKGPFLPIAILLFSAFIFACILLWKVRFSIQTTSTEHQAFAASH